MSICIKDNIQNMNLVIGCTVGCSYCYARNNVKRYRMIDDFSKPEFFPKKLRLMEKKRPQNFLLGLFRVGNGLQSFARGFDVRQRDCRAPVARDAAGHALEFAKRRLRPA